VKWKPKVLVQARSHDFVKQTDILSKKKKRERERKRQLVSILVLLFFAICFSGVLCYLLGDSFYGLPHLGKEE
jgi:hypothetical protein